MNNKPWLSHYDKNVPANIEYPTISLHDLFFQISGKFPNQTCIRSEGMEYGYGEIQRLILSLASSLIKLGIQPGQRVGLVLPNIPEFVIAYYAILAAGGVVVPLNPVYTLAELSLQIRKTQIGMVFGWYKRLDLLRQLKQQNNIHDLVICGENETHLQIKPDFHPLLTEEKEYSFDELLIDTNQSIALPIIPHSLPALFQFSGGTTGTPKAAVALHRNVIANVFQFRNWLSSLEDGREQFLTVIPLSHVYGMVIGLNVGIAMGATINLISDPRDTKKILETIQRNRISFYPGVPTMYHSINQDSDVKAGKYDLSTIKACISGSAPLSAEIRKQFETLTGGKLVEGYGLSEAPTATHCNPIMGENRTGSIGFPLPDVDCRIERSDEYGPEVGELCIKGPQVMDHYHEDEEETKSTIVDGWLRTGDIARMDEDGYFYLMGRKKDLIKVGGLQVWPKEVETAIGKMSGIKEVVVAGIPDEAKGERVKAWVVCKEGFSISPNAITEYCANEIAHFKIPGEIEFVSEIPRTPVGKVLRRELVRKEVEKEKRE